MHAILLQARGARWVIVGLTGIAGLASGLLAKAMPWNLALSPLNFLSCGQRFPRERK